MSEIHVHLIPESGGRCRINATCGESRWEHVASEDDVRTARQAVQGLMKAFERGTRPIVDPVDAADAGVRLRNAFLAPLYEAVDSPLSNAEGALLFVSDAAECLNLPWELLPRKDGGYLIEDPRWSIRRTTRNPLPESSTPLVARPLRILFVACAPTNLTGLDFEKEEEAFLHIANRLGNKVHLDIAEAGTFDELRDLIAEYKPHVVHLSGHGAVEDGVGWFCFEDERGEEDARNAREIADHLFAGKGVRLVFVSGCQTAQAGAAGLCQSLTSTGHVPLALGWGESIADELATEFANRLYHDLAAGQTVDRAVNAARRSLFDRCRTRSNNVELFDASFALPQLYAAESTRSIIDEQRPPERVERPGVRYELLADNIRGLWVGFVGRRRILQKARPALCNGEKHVLLLTGIGGAGKSTLATRLANRFKSDGFHVAAVRAQDNEKGLAFCLRLATEIAVACQQLGRERDERDLLDGERPIGYRLRLAVEVLNNARILLVLDNLEAAMPAPPAEPQWSDPDFAGFMRDLTARLVGEGRAILTCRYVPEGFDIDAPNLAHEPLPDFTEADFFKYLRRHEAVAKRIEKGELSGELLAEFNKKLGGTPRFIEQACVILARIDPDDLREQLERVNARESETDPDDLYQLQQNYFSDLFLPQLYDALAPDRRLALSRLAVTEVPLPLDGVALVSGIGDSDVHNAIDQWLQLGLLQRFCENGEIPLFAVYPLQRAFLIETARLDEGAAHDAHQAAAAFLRRTHEDKREKELRLPIVMELLACLYHATEAQDRDSRRWAAVKLASRLVSCAEYEAAVALVEPLLLDGRHPDVLNILARVRLETSDWKPARELYIEVLELRQSLEDRSGEASAWHNLASIDKNEGNREAARRGYAKSLAIRRAIGDLEGQAVTLNNMAAMDVDDGKYRVARENLEKVLVMYQAMGSLIGEAGVYHILGGIDLYEGRFVEARQNFVRSLKIKQVVGDRVGEAAVWHALGSVDVGEQKFDDARQNFHNSLAISRVIRNRACEGATSNLLALIALYEGKDDDARQNYDRALTISQAIGDRESEASAWHGLGSVDSHEKRYAEAHAKYVRSLAISQEIGDRECESASLYQIGRITWERAQRDVGIRLMMVGLAIRTAIGSGDVPQLFPDLISMSMELGMDQAEFEKLTQEVVDDYRRDRGAALVEAAFEGL